MANFSPITVESIVGTDTSAPGPAAVSDPVHEEGNNIVGSRRWPTTDAGTAPELTGLVEGYITWTHADPTGLGWEGVLQDPQAVSNMLTFPLTPASAGTEQTYSFPKTPGVPQFVVSACKD
jgi:hypothetical protein